MRMKEKKKIRDVAFSHLKDVEKLLHKEFVRQRIAQEFGLETVHLRKEPEPTPQIQAPDLLQDLSALRNIILNQIKTRNDMYGAMGFWSSGNILDFTVEQRSTICSALLDRAKELGIKPRKIWMDVLKNPVFYEAWSNEVYKDHTEEHVPLHEEAIAL